MSDAALPELVGRPQNMEEIKEMILNRLEKALPEQERDVLLGWIKENDAAGYEFLNVLAYFSDDMYRRGYDHGKWDQIMDRSDSEHKVNSDS